MPVYKIVKSIVSRIVFDGILEKTSTKNRKEVEGNLGFRKRFSWAFWIVW